MTTIPDHVLSKAVGLLNSNCCGPAFNAYDDKDSPSVITVSKLLMDPPATDVAALVEALQVIQRETTAVTPELENLELCVGTIHSYVTRILAPFTKGQIEQERQAWEAGR